MIIEYDGSGYVGWQTQPNGLAVQEVLEQAIQSVTGETVTLQGSGRTDSGVHARAQVAHFDTAARMAADKFSYALNTFLPADIRVLFSEEAPPDFHSRFSAKEKSYRYTVQLGPHARVQTRSTALHIHTVPDLGRMCQASQEVIGEHDFRSFMSAGTQMENTVRTVFRSSWSRDGFYLHYDVTGNGFLYNMVRILVGTMLEIGNGKLPVSAIQDAFTCPDRSLAGATAPAKGLTLYRVKYPDFDTDEIIKSL